MGNVSSRATSRSTLSTMHGSKPGKEKAINTTSSVAAANPSDVVTDQLDDDGSGPTATAGEQDEGDVYVEVAVLVKKLKVLKDGTILLSCIQDSLTLNYAELSKGSSESGDSTPYYMTHGTGSDTVQFGICEEGPFGPVNIFSSPLECRKINIAGSFTNCTMSNDTNTLYLSGGEEGSDVTIVKSSPSNSNSRFVIDVQQREDNSVIRCLIYLHDDLSLYFKYNSDEKVVKIDKYDESCKSLFEFWLEQVPNSVPAVKFNDKCTSTN